MAVPPNINRTGNQERTRFPQDRGDALENSPCTQLRRISVITSAHQQGNETDGLQTHSGGPKNKNIANRWSLSWRETELDSLRHRLGRSLWEPFQTPCERLSTRCGAQPSASEQMEAKMVTKMVTNV